MSGLAEALIGGDPKRLFRLGEVESVNPGPPRTLTVDGREMRYFARASVTDTVLYVDEGNDPFVIGKLSNGDDGVPIGASMDWHTNTAPPGWLFCNGQSTSGYPLLAAVVGPNVPDVRGRFMVGAGGAYAVGARGGLDTVTLQWGQMPAHEHFEGSHSHSQPTHAHFMGHVHGNPGHDHGFATRTDNRGFHNHIMDIVLGTGSTAASHRDRPGRLSEGPFEGAFNAANAGTLGSGGHDHGLSGRTENVKLGDTGGPTREFTTFDGGENTGATDLGSTNTAGRSEAHENRPPYEAVHRIIRAY